MSEPVAEPVAPQPTPTPEPAKPAEPAPAPAEPAEPAKPAEPAAEPAKAEPAKAEPIAYADFKLPEGLKLDEASMGSFKEIAGKHQLSQEVAQELVDFHTKALQEVAGAATKSFETTLAGWKAEIEADPELGGKAAEVQKVLGRALDEYGSPEARAAFDATGAGWNPHIVRTFYNMAKALTEGGAVLNGRPAGAKAQTLGGRLYPEQGNS